ncbi:FG-GAP repeat-containing protein [Micromonospora pattaloongensis]|uniref:FG-GAP repeat-containing protein n=1 Tax=Micromonospora pattaloongensis TaxID=405436 RepID=A0A1H3SMW8_9ACTN|nr:VCBS repeat-containing protein [Micromonospora pattaloongensis]SDZ39028.1 FG-GAP repeat-containing protein [Micromonospora pattaloongensis]
MKIAQGTRAVAVGLVSLLTVAATSASAASNREAPPRPAVAATNAADIPVERRASEHAAEPTPAESGSGPAPRGTTAVRPAATAPQSTAAPAGGRAEPRFDIDGDGKDELVVLARRAIPGGLALLVQYGLGRRDIVTAPPGHRLSSSPTAGDFNGDGFQDIAVGGSREVSPGVVEKGILVYAGGPDGLDRDNVQYLPGLNRAALAAGDVNNDGRDDLAFTANGVTPERDGPFRGSVTVLSGTDNGLTLDGSMTLRQVVPRWTGLVDEHFGTGLAMGDFTGDGYDDLVVAGTRRGTNEYNSHGMVTLFPGSATGPDTAKVTKIEAQLDAAGESLPVDVMTMSDMDRDGRDELILGLPRYANGQVVYLRGAASGLRWAGHRVIDPDSPGVPGGPDRGFVHGNFGYSLATGDATGDGIPDLLVGAISVNVGPVEDAGAVTLIPGTKQGPTGAGSYVYTQQVAPLTWDRRPDPSISDRPEYLDYLGSSVAILDLDGVGPLEMFAESMYEGHSEQTGEIGLLTSLQLQPLKTGRGSPAPPRFRFVPVRQQRPADFSAGGIRIERLESGLLSN